MFPPTKDKLRESKVIAEKDGYQLLEKHAVIFLHNWIEKNDSVNLDTQIKCLLESLKFDFDLSPAHTIWQLEEKAKESFQDLDSLLKSL